MKTLKLEMDDLVVETFATDANAGSDATKTLLDFCTRMTGLCPCTPAI